MGNHATVTHRTERAQTLPISSVHLGHSEVAEVALSEEQILPPQGGTVWVEEHLQGNKRKRTLGRSLLLRLYYFSTKSWRFLDPRPSTDQFLPLFGQKWGLPEFLADPESLQLQGYWAGVGGDCALRNAQLLLQECSVGAPAALGWIAAVRLLLGSEHCCTELILQREGTRWRWLLGEAFIVECQTWFKIFSILKNKHL